MFSSRRKNVLKIFFKILVFKIFIGKMKKFEILKIQNFGFFDENFENQHFRFFDQISFSSKIFDFQHFWFFRWKFWKPKFRKIFPKYFFAEMKKCFWFSFFSTVWTKSLDSPKTAQSTRGSSSMPRQGIALRGCL